VIAQNSGYVGRSPKFERARIISTHDTGGTIWFVYDLSISTSRDCVIAHQQLIRRSEVRVHTGSKGDQLARGGGPKSQEHGMQVVKSGPFQRLYTSPQLRLKHQAGWKVLLETSQRSHYSGS